MMAKSHAELRRLTDEELIALYDAHTKNTVIGLNAIGHEIERRESERQSAEMTQLSRRMDRLTRFGVIVAVASLAASIVTLVLSLGAA